MGTRNLTLVVLNQQFLLAQYCQWDGYPEGQGITALTFARDRLDRDTFLSNLMACPKPSDEEIQGYYTSVGADGSGWVTIDVASKFKAKWPTLNRDMGANVLEYIQTNGPSPIRLEVNFAADSLFCEWAWLIDFDKNTFEAYKGFNTTPLPPDARFANLPITPKSDYKDAEQYYPVRLVRSWPLANLPTNKEFLASFKEDGEEDDAIMKAQTAT